MTEACNLAAVRESYDRVAKDYVRVAPARFEQDATGRGMLTAFAELVQATGRRTVADVGCGPGHVTAHLDGLGLSTFGVDLSPTMVQIARDRYPALRFQVGSMTELELPDSQLGGIVAWWSIVHLPRNALPVVFAGFHRTLAPGGWLLLGFHAGDKHLRPSCAYGHPVSHDTYLLPPDVVTDLLRRAGMVVTAQLIQEPDGDTTGPQACIILARRPVAE